MSPSVAATGTGDPARTLALLWEPDDEPGARKGPGRGLTVRRIVDEAVACADDSGLDAVTMRALAGRLGVSAMGLYTYVPGKAELIDLMVDRVNATSPLPHFGDEGWQARFRAVAESNRALLGAHPWLVDVAALSRPPLGPGTVAKYDRELAAFEGLSISDVERDGALAHLLGFVYWHARSALEATRAAASDGGDLEWWEAHQGLLAKALDPARFPLAARVGQAAGTANGTAWDATSAWAFGLECTVEGLGRVLGL